MNLLSKFICSLGATSSLKAQGLAIIKNLITILRNPTFVASAVFIELQNLINYLLYITKLFRIDPCTLQELLKLIAALQTALVNSASFIQGIPDILDKQALLVPLGLEVTRALPALLGLEVTRALPALGIEVTRALLALPVPLGLEVTRALLALLDLKVTRALLALPVPLDLEVTRALLALLDSR